MPSALIRPIPAGAGRPRSGDQSVPRWTAYPRGCGATGVDGWKLLRGMGLSPRVRGDLGLAVPNGERRRPIPAGAGRPFSTQESPNSTQAYPRGCGAITANNPLGLPPEGLSPRVRGDLLAGLAMGVHLGPIPAGAGRPATSLRRRPPIGAYPRGCGATNYYFVSLSFGIGLSPRVRGDPAHHVPLGAYCRPIPAGAGRPFRPHGLRRADGGLSPRVRGDQRVRREPPARRGPIPAGAGRPCASSCAPSCGRAYPRGCGATLLGMASQIYGRGLSPRVRGDRVCRNEARTARGPIPAGAGRPPGDLAMSETT